MSNGITVDTLYFEVLPFPVAEVEAGNLLSSATASSRHWALPPPSGKFTLGELRDKAASVVPELAPDIRRRIPPIEDTPVFDQLKQYRNKMSNKSKAFLVLEHAPLSGTREVSTLKTKRESPWLGR